MKLSVFNPNAFQHRSSKVSPTGVMRVFLIVKCVHVQESRQYGIGIGTREGDGGLINTKS
jgi:hypothetical protein